MLKKAERRRKNHKLRHMST